MKYVNRYLGILVTLVKILENSRTFRKHPDFFLCDIAFVF